MNDLKFIKGLGLNILDLNKKQTIDFMSGPVISEKKAIGYINAHAIRLIRSDQSVANSFMVQDFTICDGHGASLVIYGLTGRWLQKMTPASFFNEFLENLNQKKAAIYIWGHSEEELKIIQERMSKKFPQLKISGMMNGYNSNLDEVVNQIQMSKPDIVLIAKGMPRQEEALVELKNKVPNVSLFCIGATLLYKFQLMREVPNLVRKIGLEWLWRWIQDPIRLTNRYLVGNTLVIFLTIKFYFKRLVKG